MPVSKRKIPAADANPPAAKGRQTTPDQPTARNQLGIEQALRHGFYSRGFKNLEHSDLEAMLSQGLESEIAMLRVVVRRAFEMTASPTGEDSQDLDKAIHVMNSLGMASIRLGSLLKIQAMLGKRDNDVGAAISEALKQVARDLKL